MAVAEEDWGQPGHGVGEMSDAELLASLVVDKLDKGIIAYSGGSVAVQVDVKPELAGTGCREGSHRSTQRMASEDDFVAWVLSDRCRQCCQHLLPRLVVGFREAGMDQATIDKIVAAYKVEDEALCALVSVDCDYRATAAHSAR